MNKVLITGVTGQCGSYLAEHLLSLGYEVHGTIRRTSFVNFSRISHILDKIQLHSIDLLDQSSIDRVVKNVMPDEIYNLAAQSFVTESWNTPISTGDITGLGVGRILESIRNIKPDTKFFQASSSEMFGKVQSVPQNEDTKFYPRSPYGVAKLYAHWMTINYRESHNLFACCGIMFNNDSPRRGEEFVTKKIVKAAVNIYYGFQDKLYLGNTSSKRDIGFSGDYVKAMHLMLQNSNPTDYVISTGKTISIQDFANLVFDKLGLDAKMFIETDKSLFRPAEVDLLIGDSSKIKSELNWTPDYDVEKLIDHMIDEEIKGIQ